MSEDLNAIAVEVIEGTDDPKVVRKWLCLGQTKAQERAGKLQQEIDDAGLESIQRVVMRPVIVRSCPTSECGGCQETD